MTAHAVRAKWRPTLSMIVFTVLIAVLSMPLVGLVFFRLYENQLVRQTEMELITQSAVLAAVFAGEVETRLDQGIELGADWPKELLEKQLMPIDPVLPRLDLARDEINDPRPDGEKPVKPPGKAYLEIGKLMSRLISETRRKTLAGILILDAHGNAIGGRDEVGLSFAHVAEVQAALEGRYASTLRIRVLEQPKPPIYSISRGTGVRVFAAYPVFLNNKVAGVIYTSRTPSNILKHLYEERRNVALATITVLLMTILIGLVFLRVITQPIRGLMEYIRQIGRGERETAQPPLHHGSREIAMLSQSFIDMAQRLSERSDYIANFAAHVSHELKTPLTSIQGAAELMRDAGSTMNDEERKRFLGNVIKDTARLTALLERLRDLARADNPRERGPVSLSTVLSDVQAAFSHFPIEADGDTSRQIAMSRENAGIVFTHLADNAIRHGASAVILDVSEADGMVHIIASDNGDGISANNQEQIFDPFFTTRRESGGTGMGLGIVRSMLNAHGGDIRLLPSDRGAVFEVTVPVG